MRNNNSNFHLGNWVQKNLTTVIVLGCLLALVVTAVMVASWRVNVINDGEVLQERLEEAHANSRIALSTCLDQGQVAAQVSEEEFAQLRNILVDVAGARYQDESSAQAALGQGALFSVVVEAYPQIDQTSFQNLQAIVVGCRDEFQNNQNRVQANVVALENWLLTGSLFSDWIRNNFPTDELEAVGVNPQTGEQATLQGEDALSYLARPVLILDADTAFDTGELEEQDLFGDDN